VSCGAAGAGIGPPLLLALHAAADSLLLGLTALGNLMIKNELLLIH